MAGHTKWETRAELIEQRDRARRRAVALEQENAALIEALGAVDAAVDCFQQATWARSLARGSEPVDVTDARSALTEAMRRARAIAAPVADLDLVEDEPDPEKRQQRIQDAITAFDLPRDQDVHAGLDAALAAAKTSDAPPG